jgi:hypothetical protein
VSRKTWIALFALTGLSVAASAQDEDLDGWNQAAGVNLSLEEGYGARHSGMAITFAGFQSDANAVANAPAAMNDVDDFTFSTAHAERFGEAKFDDFALLVPIESRSTLGLGVSRYGVSGIDLRPEGVSPLESQPAGQFSIADYLVAAAFARRFGNPERGVLDVGASFNLLYRQLDQDGMGVRADAMVQYTWRERFRIGTLLKGLIPSSAAWESGYSEYEVPDLHIGLALRQPAPYFYGTLQAAYQSEGLFQKRAKAQGEDYGSRVFSSPPKALLAGNLGLEFLFDFGLAVRFGFSELDFGDGPLSSAAFGIGYAWRQMLGLDYSFAPHPDLLASHRIALQFTPAFPKFKGRNFRHGGKEPVRIRPSAPKRAAPAPEDDEGAPELEEPSNQGSAPEPGRPVRAASPAPAAAPAESAPAPAPASPAAAKPAAAPAEQLEAEEAEESE